MNFELLNPFAQDFPENFETSIDATALCTRFNPRGVFAGHFLAVGRMDGVVSIIDFETKGIVRYLEGHVKAVTTVCWSHNSRYLLTASRDWNVIIWDLSSTAANTPQGERRDTVRFDAPVTSAHLHPRNSKLLIVTLHAQVQPVFVDLRLGIGGRWDLDVKVEEDEAEAGENLEGAEPGEGENGDEEGTPKKSKEISTMCRFNPRGDLMYVGTSKGNINIWDVQTKAFIRTENIGSHAAIKHMEFDQKGSSLVVNSNDRSVRVLNLVPLEWDSDEEEPEILTREQKIPILELQHRFQDLVNKTPWNGCGFSRDGEYIIGGAGHKASHNIYVWDKESGGLLKILEGPKDPLEDLDWHPIRPLIASVSSLGLIHIWVTGITENWSAYAPGFEELDENVEYQEKEDEFDIEDESVIKRRKADEQDRRVDINTIQNARSVSPPIEVEDDFEIFVSFEPDADNDIAFYPAPELDPWYEIEDEVPDQVLSSHAGGQMMQTAPAAVHLLEDIGNVSEELFNPEEGRYVKKKTRGRKRREREDT